jgi:preprotein translocase subunit SecG
VHLLIVLALGGVVLLQRSEGGGLGIGGGGAGSFFTGRGQANLLTRITAILGAGFFVTSLALSWWAGFNRAPSSVLDRVAPASTPGSPAAPPAGGNVLDQLRGLQQGAPAQPAAPAAPSAPATPSAPAPGSQQQP